jgi:hypothetical protein
MGRAYNQSFGAHMKSKAVQMRLLDVDRLEKREVVEYIKALEVSGRNLATHAQSFVNTPTHENSKALLLARKIFGLAI